MSDQPHRSGSALVSTMVALVVFLGAGLAGASQSGLGQIVAKAQRVFSLPGGTHTHIQASDRLPPESGEQAAQPVGVLPSSPGEDGDGLVGSRAQDAANGAEEEQTDGSLGGSSDDGGGSAAGDEGEGLSQGDGVPNAEDHGGGNGGTHGNSGNGGNGGGTPGGSGHASGGSNGSSGGGSSTGGGSSHGNSGGGNAGSEGGAADDHESTGGGGAGHGSAAGEMGGGGPDKP